MDVEEKKKMRIYKAKGHAPYRHTGNGKNKNIRKCCSHSITSPHEMDDYSIATCAFYQQEVNRRDREHNGMSSWYILLYIYSKREWFENYSRQYTY